jgi:hypothetical protein
MIKHLFPQNRYYRVRNNRTKLAELIKEDKELLSKFGFVIDSIDPGISGHLEEFIETNEREQLFCPNFSMINLNSTAWWWLRPLLVELLKYREQQCLATNGNKEQ